MRRLVFAVALWFAALAPVQGAVTIDNDGTATLYTSAGTVASPDSNFASTVAVGATDLVCTVYYNNQIPTVTSFVWAAQSMTLLTSTNGTNSRLEIWGIQNPTSGANNGTLTWNVGGARLSIDCTSWTGGDGTFAAATPTTGTSTTPSITINSATGNFVVAAFGDDGGASATISVNNVLIYTNTSGRVNGSNRQTGAATVTQTATITSSTWIAVGTDIKAAAAGSGQANPLSMLGVGP